MQDIIVRSLIIGASVGLLLGLLNIVPPGRAIALGMIAGFLAGLTRYKVQKGRKREDGGDSK
jgi:H+/Cl- antiporter ClcA